MSLVLRGIGLCGCATAMWVGSVANGQCDDWRAGPLQSLAGTDGSIYATATWDPDGTGPLGEQLVIAGSFKTAGGVVCNGIARWDGTTWQPFGSGLDSPDFAITSMTTWDPDGSSPMRAQLVVGGNFGSIGGVSARRVASWDGFSWHALNIGLTWIPSALTTWDTTGGGTSSQLVAGGIDNVNNSFYQMHVSMYEGSDWIEQGTEVAPTPAEDGIVFALATWKPPVGAPLLILGGSFAQIAGVQAQGVAAWNGTTWQSLGTSSFSQGQARAFTTWDPDGAGSLGTQLVAGGDFKAVATGVTNSVVRWDGAAWHAVGTGPSSSRLVLSLLVSDTDGTGSLPTQLVRGVEGEYSGAALSTCERWDGSAWQPMGPLDDSAFITDLVNADIDGTGPQHIQPVAVGAVEALSDRPLHGIAHWDGAAWQPFLAPLPKVYSIGKFGSRIVYGGDHLVETVDGVTSSNIVTWDGLNVEGISTGLDGNVLALESYAPSNTVLVLIAGGAFSNAGAVAVNNVAQWTENTLTGAKGWTAMGAGLNGDVLALERSNGSTFASGTFTASGATSIPNIARWDGSAWQPLGTGLNNTCRALKSFTTGPTINLVAGGLFTTAGGNAANRIAVWSTNSLTNNSSWSAMGNGFNNTVFAIERYGSATYAAGQFTASGATTINHIARWDGSAWQPLGTGVNGTVRSLLSEGGYLYVGGTFSSAGGVSVNNLARWDGSAWSDVRGGADSTVYSLGAYHGEVHAGGDFANIRNGAIPSTGVGRYLETGAPWVADQPPTSQRGCVRMTTSLSMQVADGYGGLSYQWRRNGVSLANGPTGTGSTIAGVTNSTLDIVRCSGFDSGMYDCAVSTSGCGSVTSGVTNLTVCISDFNCDGGKTVSDIFAYLSSWFTLDARADVNGIAGINVADIFYFLSAWFAGC